MPASSPSVSRAVFAHFRRLDLRLDDDATNNRIFHVSVWLGLLHTLLMVALPQSALLAHTVADDAFYYLEIARRFVQQGAPTFDGTHVTTGVHPLWFFVMSGLLKVIPDDPWVGLRAVLGVSSLLVLAWAWALRRLLQPVFGMAAATVVASIVASSSGILRIGLLGMETSVAVLFLLLFLHELFIGKRAWRVGVFAGLTILGRLDMIIVVSIALALEGYSNRKQLWQRWLTSGALIVGIVAPFFVWIHSLTGHWVTTSAATKSWVVAHEVQKQFGGRFSLGYVKWAAHAAIESLQTLGKIMLGSIVRGAGAIIGGDLPAEQSLSKSIGLVVVISGALMVFGWVMANGHQFAKKVRSKKGIALMTATGLGALFHIAATSLLLPSQSDRWYWGVEVIASLVILAYVYSLGGVFARLVTAFGAASATGTTLLLMGVLTGLSTGDINHHESFGNATYSLAEEIRQTVPSNDVVASCNAGGLGWFSRRGVVNVDGLVNDFSFLEARASGKVRDWMRTEGVNWFADCVPREKQAGYARELGINPNEIELVLTTDGGKCEGILWKLHWDERNDGADL